MAVQAVTTQSVQSLMLTIRAQHFKRPSKATDRKNPVIYWEETSFGNQPFDVPLIILRTGPCRWFTSGGCTMCNYELLAIDEGVSEDDILDQVHSAINSIGPLGQYKYIFLTSQGSFFDNAEVSDATRLRIATLLKAQGVCFVSTESEAKHCLDGDRLKAFADIIERPVSIGIGLEALDPFIRNVIINKGLKLEILERAAQTIHASGMSFYTYVTLGKPFLTIEEDIADAVESVKASFALGATMVVLETINIQPFTLTEELFKLGLYQPAKIWSGIECLQRLPDSFRSRVSLKGIEADIEPVPLTLADTCERCRAAVVEGIRSWNYFRENATLTKLTTLCDCRDLWSAGLVASEQSSLEVRVRNGLSAVERSLEGGARV